MGVLNISIARVKDRAAFERYLEQAARLMAEADVEVVARGSYLETQAGRDAPDHVSAVFRYASIRAARGFFASDAYRALIPLRDKACDMTIRFYAEPAEGGAT